MHLYTMGDIARFSEYGEKMLFKKFGVKAELIIDHTWGYEPCTIKDIKAYIPSKHSLSIGQVLKCPYSFEDGKLIVKEMTESLMLDLVSKHLVTEKLELRIVYDHENVPRSYTGDFEKDQYGRKTPSHVHSIMHLEMQTASTNLTIQAMMQTYQRIVNPALSVRKINVVAMDVVPETQAKEKIVQYSFLMMWRFWKKNASGKMRNSARRKFADRCAVNQGTFRKECHFEGHEFSGAVHCD